MSAETDILKSLEQLDGLCSAGYAIALHIHYTAPKFLFQTYDSEWMKTYSEQGLVLKDPTVAWGFENTGIAHWQDLEPLDEAGVLAKARAFGLRHGFTCATDKGDSRTIASFARDDRESTPDEITQICEIVEALHDYTAGIDAISQRDRDRLKEMSVVFTHV